MLLWTQLMKRMLEMGYLHVTFLLKLRSHLHKSELLRVTTIKVNKRAFGFRETNPPSNSSGCLPHGRNLLYI